MSTAARNAPIHLNGKDVKFLPLNWEQLENIQADLDAVTNMKAGPGRASFFTVDERNSILKIITVSIRDSNPELAAEDGFETWVKRSVNLSNVNILLARVFNANGFDDAASGTALEGAAAGEGEAEAVGSGS